MYKSAEKKESETQLRSSQELIQNQAKTVDNSQLLDNRPEAVAQRQIFSSSAAKNAPVQRTLAADLLAMTADKDNTDDPLLKLILEEVLATEQQANVNVAYGPSNQKSHAEPVGNHGVNRGFNVVIDQTQYTDDEERQSIIMHELLHASADSKYAFNAKHNENAMNTTLRGNNANEEFAFAGQQFRFARDLAIGLAAQAEKDRGTLGDGMADHVIDRANRIAGANTQEFDTVSSELLYYMRMKMNAGDEKTKTFRQVRNMAEAAYNARNNNIPLSEGYLEPDSFREFAVKSACFLTTACAYVHGLDDDCEELTTLRALRDGYMRQREEDEALIKRYYEIAPAILDGILQQPERVKILRSLYRTICDCVDYVKKGQPEKAVSTYRIMVEELQQKYVVSIKE